MRVFRKGMASKGCCFMRGQGLANRFVCWALKDWRLDDQVGVLALGRG